MKFLCAILIACTSLVCAQGAQSETSDTATMRRGFLLGMSSGGGLITGEGGLEGFWPGEKSAATLYETVAKLYAQDLGVASEDIASGKWKATVAESLRAEKEGDPLAFLAGAFARWGMPAGFRVSGSEKGFAIARRVSDLNLYRVQLVHEAGYPGGSAITVSDGGESRSEEFFSGLRQIAIEVVKEPGQKSGPTSELAPGRGVP